MPTDSEPTPVPMSELWTLFTEWVQLDEEEWVLTEMVTKLSEFGITKAFQVKKAPDNMLEAVLPMPQYARHYLAALHVRDTQRQWDADQQGPQQDTAMATALEKLVTESKAARRSRKRNRDDASLSDEEAAASTSVATQSLREYNIHTVPRSVWK